MSLLALPVEILHRVLDDLDIFSILISFRRVCRRFNAITNTYNRYELDLSSISESNIKFIARLIQPENIISLILSYEWHTKNTIDVFFKYFNEIQRFCQLRSLTLNKINDSNFDQILNIFAMCPLSSLSIHTRDRISREMGVRLSSAITRFKLCRLNLKNFYHIIKDISWPQDCTICHITLENCTHRRYQIILDSLPHLKTFVMKNYIIKNRHKTLLKSDLQLISLTISDCHLSIEDIELVISQTPLLKYLTLGSHRTVFDTAFNGSSWEQFIQTNLSSLVKFQFFFFYTMSNDDTLTDIDSLLNSFRTPFWLNNKRCVVTCDYNMEKKIINLYSTPICWTKTSDIPTSLLKFRSPAVTIRWKMSSMIINCSPTVIWTDGIFYIAQTEVLHLFNYISFSSAFFNIDVHRNQTSIDSYRP
jgi:hypothetical protein